MLYSAKWGDRVIDKNLHLMVQSIEKPFFRVKRYFLTKVRRGDTFERGRRIGGSSFRASGTLSVRVACRKGILWRISGSPIRHAFFYTSCLDVIVTGILRIPIEEIVIHFGLKGLMTVKIAACHITGRSLSLSRRYRLSISAES